jgi:hypothetical protein
VSGLSSVLNVTNALEDEITLSKCIRSHLKLTPHRTSKLKNLILFWAANGVLLEDGHIVTLTPQLALGQLRHALQQPCTLRIDEGALKDITAALLAASTTRLSELGVFQAVALDGSNFVSSVSVTFSTVAGISDLSSSAAPAVVPHSVASACLPVSASASSFGGTSLLPFPPSGSSATAASVSGSGFPSFGGSAVASAFGAVATTVLGAGSTPAPLVGAGSSHGSAAPPSQTSVLKKPLK